MKRARHVQCQARVRRGFTLVELLLAATLISILFVGLGAHLRGGITVWRRTTQVGEQLQRQRVALTRLERDLANAIRYDDRETAYGDTLGLLPPIQFAADTLAWVTIVPTSRQGSSAVRFLTYQCTRVDDVPGLWRTSQSLGEARARREPVFELFLPDCEELSLRYAALPSTPNDPLSWGAWESDLAAGLPRFVEVTIRLGSGAEIMRTVGIPIGSGQPGEAPPT